MYVLIAILIFGILITTHELGHFMAAKACGVRVLEFAIGMGPTVFKRQKGETVYSLRALPVGGFCAMEGDDKASEDPRAFTNQKTWKKLLILVAGAAMNFLMGFVLILLVFSNQPDFAKPTVTEFMEGCPYESADGLREGDTFYKIDGHRIYLTSNVTTYLSRSGERADIVLIRDGEKVLLEDYYIVPVEYEQNGQNVMKYGLYFGVKESGFGARLKYTWYTSLDFVRIVWMSLTDLVTGAVGVNELSGVVGIVGMISDVGQEAETASAAFDNIAYLSALIAINLAVMNLLPLPALDGGRVLFLAVTWVIQTVFRKNPDPKYEGYIHAAGLVLLLGFMVYVMYNDVVRLITG